MTGEMAKTLQLPLHHDNGGFNFPMFGPEVIPVRTEDTWYDWPVYPEIVSESLK